MTISEFAKTLYPYCSNGLKRDMFFVELVDNIIETQQSVLSADNANPLMELTADMLKRIYEGKKPLASTNATSILRYLDKGRFEDYMNQLPNDSLIALCTDLQNYGVHTIPIDVPNACANIFEEILRNCATGKLEPKQTDNSVEFDAELTFMKNLQPQKQISSSTAFYVKDGKVHISGETIRLPKKLLPPDVIEVEEMIYVTELFSAYNEAEQASNVSQDTLHLHQKYKRNFDDQRSNYWNAEYLRRSLKEVFVFDDVDPFEVLKDETYTGIVDVCDSDYKNGYIRLLETLKHVVLLNLSKSQLSQIEDLIGNSEKKGLCHMLVNDLKIRWVGV